MKSTVTSCKASELVEDFDLYPRVDVDSYHVNQLAEAIRAGADLPPIIADEKTKRIIDGFHRRRAFMRVGKDSETVDEDPLVPVEYRSYRTESDMFVDAMKYNSRHGRNMTAQDKTRASLIAQRLGIEAKVIAIVLNIQPTTLKEIKSHVATVEGTRTKVPLKLPVRHLSGGTITDEQEKAMPHVSGSHYLYHVNQLLLAIRKDLLDRKNEKLMEGLKTLATEIRNL